MRSLCKIQILPRTQRHLHRFQEEGNSDNPGFINFREVVQVNFDMEKVIRVLIELLEEQEGVKIEYTLEKTA